MKIQSPIRPRYGMAVFLAASLLTSLVAKAVPYASQVVRTGDNVSFVLNHPAQGIAVLLNGTTPLSPSINATTAGVKTFSMAGYSSFQIIVTGNVAKAWTQVIADGTDRQFYMPRGVAINKNPASANFGKVYVSEGRGGGVTGGRTTTDGIYVLRADGAADGGVKTGGVNWTSDGLPTGDTSRIAPLRVTVGPDDHLYVTGSNHLGWLVWEFNDDMSVATQLINDSNKTGTGSTIQSVTGVWVEGTRAAGNRQVSLVNGTYNDTSRKGLIRYDLAGNATATADDKGTQLVGPTVFNYYPYDVARDSLGYWYLNNYRSTAGQALALVKFDGAIIPNNTAAMSVPNTYVYTESMDLNEPQGVVATGRYDNGIVQFFDMNTGTFKEQFDCGSRAREVAFDAAGNLVTVDNGAERARFWSPGGYTIATTTSAGAFSVFTPDTLQVVATDATASESGDTAMFTVSRSGGPNGLLQVQYSLSGTAANGSDYTIAPASPLTFNPGETSLIVTVNPNSDSQREQPETVILSLVSTVNYYVGNAGTATATITDNNAVARYWDVNGSDPGPGGGNPFGNWTDANWNSFSDGSGPTSSWTPWAVPVFSAGGEAFGEFTVNVSGTQYIDSPIFEEGLVTIDGGTLVLTNFDSINIAIDQSVRINSTIAGVSGLSKGDAGTLTLAGANTYTGPTVVKAGTLVLGASEAIPNSSSFTMQGGIFNLNAFNETVGSLAGIGEVQVSGGSTLTFGGNNTDTLWDGTIAAAGGTVVKTGTGTVDIGPLGVISETLAISNGAVSVNAAGDFGSSSTDIIIDGGKILETSAVAAGLAPSSRSLVLGNHAVIEVAEATGIATYGTATSTGIIRGGKLVKEGPGELRISGVPMRDSTFEKLVVNGGIYRGGFATPIQDEKFLGATPGAFLADQITINNGATLGHSLNPFEISATRGIVLGAGGGRIANSWVIPGVISGSTLYKDQSLGTLAGTLILSGANTYIGGTVLAGGNTILARNTIGSATGSGSVNVTNATLGGDGRVGGPVLMNSSVLSPGYNYTVGYAALTRISNSIAKLVISNGLNMSASSTNTWHLGALNTVNAGVDFDQVELTGGNLVLGGSSHLTVSFVGTAAGSAADPFWQQSRSWKLISLTGTASNPGNTTFSSISGTNAYTGGTFSTVADVTGVSLVYTVASKAVTNVTISVSGGSININYTDGGGSQVVLLQSASLEVPVASWQRVATNPPSGTSFSIPAGSEPRSFYRIVTE